MQDVPLSRAQVKRAAAEMTRADLAHNIALLRRSPQTATDPCPGRFPLGKLLMDATLCSASAWEFFL